MNSKSTPSVPLGGRTPNVSVFDKIRDWSASRSWSSPYGSGETAESIRIEVVETAESFIVRAELPGAEKSAIDVIIDDNVLTIRAPGRQSIRMAPGSVVEPRVCTLTLPEAIDDTKSIAEYDLGVLLLTLSKAQAVAARAKEPVGRQRAEVHGQGLDKDEQQKALDRLPEWACQQRVTEVLAVKATLPVRGSLDEFATFVMEQTPDPIPARLSDPALGDILADAPVAVAVFPSGAIRTVGTVLPGGENSVLLAPFDYWSLIDPEDDQLAPGEEVLHLELSMLAVVTRP